MVPLLAVRLAGARGRLTRAHRRVTEQATVTAQLRVHSGVFAHPAPRFPLTAGPEGYETRVGRHGRPSGRQLTRTGSGGTPSQTRRIDAVPRRTTHRHSYRLWYEGLTR